MRRLLIGVILLSASFLAGCSNKPEIPKVVLQEVTAEKVIDKPDRRLMEVVPAKKKLDHGMDDGQIATTVSNNNLRAGTIEWKYLNLQQYVCNIFKESVGDVCKKGEK